MAAQKVINFLAKHRFWALAAILATAFLLRIIFLDTIPGGLNCDESLIVYNAYSLAQTGQDVYGDSYPIHLKGYGWGENSLLVYLLIPLIKTFGLDNVLVFRLLIVLIHLLIIFFVYILVKELFDIKTALIATALVAISPWDLVLSRLLYNVSIVPLFYLAGIFYLIRGIKLRKKTLLIYSGIAFSLSLYTYALSFIWLPLILLFILLIYWQEIKILKIWQHLSFWGCLAVLSWPIILFYLQNQLGVFSQLDKIYIFSLPHLLETRFNYVTILNGLAPWTPLIFIINYLAHFDPIFLFNEVFLSLFVKHFGLIHYFCLPFLFLGLYQAVINYKQKNYKLLVIWLLFAPLPVALTSNNIPHPLRFINALPTFEILIALGIVYFIYNIYSQINKKYLINLLVIFTIGNLILYEFCFIYYYPRTSYNVFQSSASQITQFINENYDNYDLFYVIDWPPNYIFMPYNYLYYIHYPPQQVIEKKINLAGDLITFDKLYFTKQIPLNYQADSGQRVIFLISAANDAPVRNFLSNKKIIKKFNNLDNKPVFIAVE